jgi:hypothetical protein
LTLALVFVAHPAFAQQPDWSYEVRGEGVHLRILRDYELAAGQTSAEPIVVVGGTAVVNGRAEQEVVVIGGTLRVGPTAVIAGDLVSIGTSLTIDPAAQVRGDVQQTIVTWPEIDRVWWAAALLAANLARLAFVLLVAAFMAIVAPHWIRAIAADGPAAIGALVVGVGVELFFVPALLVVAAALVISVIGAPLLLLLPLLPIAAGIVWMAGLTAVFARVGAVIRGTRVAASSSLVLDVFVGFLVVTAPALVAHIMSMGPQHRWPAALWVGSVALAIEYVAWTVGLGVAVATVAGRRGNDAPPALPLPAHAAAPGAV